VESHFQDRIRKEEVNDHPYDPLNGIGIGSFDPIGHNGQGKLQMHWNATAHQI
jgi:hypothetical protein